MMIINKLSPEDKTVLVEFALSYQTDTLTINECNRMISVLENNSWNLEPELRYAFPEKAIGKYETVDQYINQAAISVTPHKPSADKLMNFIMQFISEDSANELVRQYMEGELIRKPQFKTEENEPSRND